MCLMFSGPCLLFFAVNLKIVFLLYSLVILKVRLMVMCHYFLIDFSDLFAEVRC